MRHVGAGVGRAGDEVRRAAQAADEIVAEIGVIPDAGERGRMQCLQHQRAQPAAEHAGKVGVNLPGRAVGPEQARVARRPFVVDSARIARKRTQHPVAERAGEYRLHVRSVGKDA